jgi:hypothetical protein
VIAGALWFSRSNTFSPLVRTVSDTTSCNTAAQGLAKNRRRIPSNIVMASNARLIVVSLLIAQLGNSLAGSLNFLIVRAITRDVKPFALKPLACSGQPQGKTSGRHRSQRGHANETEGLISSSSVHAPGFSLHQSGHILLHQHRLYLQDQLRGLKALELPVSGATESQQMAELYDGGIELFPARAICYLFFVSSLAHGT